MRGLSLSPTGQIHCISVFVCIGLHKNWKRLDVCSELNKSEIMPQKKWESKSCFQYWLFIHGFSWHALRAGRWHFGDLLLLSPFTTDQIFFFSTSENWLSLYWSFTATVSTCQQMAVPCQWIAPELTILTVTWLI